VSPRFSNLGGVRRVAIVAIAAAGVGLFGTGVRGLTALDGELADATGRSPAQEVRSAPEPRDDCPSRDDRRERRLERSL
jgi:hypothetical protein